MIEKLLIRPAILSCYDGRYCNKSKPQFGVILSTIVSLGDY